jgi:TatD DNase family protein
MKPAWRTSRVNISNKPIPALGRTYALIDSHCHLDMTEYRDDLGLVLERAAAHGVKGVVTIGIDLASSQAGVAIAKTYHGVRAAIGIHPHDAGKATRQDLENLAALAAEPEVVAYGEIGLDYVKKYSDPETQQALFIKQLNLAKELQLPVVIHDREAHEDCLKYIRTAGPFEHGGIMHCFSGDMEYARKLIDCNFHISIPGIVTYKKADQMQGVAKQVPLERLLVETDGPFLAPVPHRGTRNEPLFTLYTAQAVADIKQISLEEIAVNTTKNCCGLFNYRFNC